MNADFGAPKELAGGLQQRRALYQPRLPPCLQVIAPSISVPSRRSVFNLCRVSLLFPCPRIDQPVLARELIPTDRNRHPINPPCPEFIMIFVFLYGRS
jgi:hypothetical protein